MITPFNFERLAIQRTVLSGCLVLLLSAPVLGAQDAPPASAKAPTPRHTQASPAAPAAPATYAAPVPNDKDVAETQHKLIELLRLSPTLTTVIARDPSLLSNQDYVSQKNPQLAAFLASHPEVARNPDFYLFTHLNHQDGTPDEALERAVWPEFRQGYTRNGFDELMSNLAPLLAFAAFLLALAWGIRLFVENRRWTRVFRLQSEVHAKLIEKFSTSQELAAYMDTDAGRRFLEAAPITVDAPSQRMPNAVSRILLPLQIGTVMILLGVGFLSLRHIGPDYDTGMRIIGTLILMPGIGFILSAGLTWLMAARLGLLKTQQAHAELYEPGPLTRR